MVASTCRASPLSQTCHFSIESLWRQWKKHEERVGGRDPARLCVTRPLKCKYHRTRSGCVCVFVCFCICMQRSSIGRGGAQIGQVFFFFWEVGGTFEYSHTHRSSIWHGFARRISRLFALKSFLYGRPNLLNFFHLFYFIYGRLLRTCGIPGNFLNAPVQVRKEEKNQNVPSAWCPPLCLPRRESCHAGNRRDPSNSLTRIQGAQSCCLMVRKHLQSLLHSTSTLINTLCWIWLPKKYFIVVLLKKK